MVSGELQTADRFLYRLRGAYLFRFAGRVAPYSLVTALITLAVGTFLGLYLGPWSAHQLAMLHIPSAWVTTLLLISAAFWAAVALVFERPAAHALVQAIVPTGGMFAFLALWSRVA